MSAFNRINREVKDLMEDNNINQNKYSIQLIDDSNMHLIAKVCGPEQTPYEGGLFKIDIQISDDYPFSPPKIRFLTKIWHPNISTINGSICQLMFNVNWVAMATIRSILIAIQTLLSSPDVSDPQEIIVAELYIFQYESFINTAKYWTNVYAMDKAKQLKISDEFLDDFLIFRDLVDILIQSKKCNKVQALDALSRNNWNIDRAGKGL